MDIQIYAEPNRMQSDKNRIYDYRHVTTLSLSTGQIAAMNRLRFGPIQLKVAFGVNIHLVE